MSLLDPHDEFVLPIVYTQSNVLVGPYGMELALAFMLTDPVVMMSHAIGSTLLIVLKVSLGVTIPGALSVIFALPFGPASGCSQRQLSTSIRRCW
jgi:hypothetical protein